MAPSVGSMIAAPTIITDIIEQHAEDAAFLWCLRDAATEQPQYTLRHLADLEERIEAHIDGLRVAGKAGLATAWAHLDQYGGPGELFVVATLSLESRNETDIERVLGFAESNLQSRRGLFGALGWVSRDALRGQVAAWLDDSSSFRRIVGVVACSLHRADPNQRMERLLGDELPVRARALRLVGELGRLELLEQIRPAMADDDEACRFWAAWSVGLLGERAASPVLQAFAVADGHFKWRALDLVVRLLNRDAAITWLRELGRDPRHARLVVIAAGIIGDPVVLPWLIQKMSAPALARVAAESFCTITGVDLLKEGLDARAPEDFVTGPTDDSSDQNVAMDPDENLPWPEPTKIAAWWRGRENSFAQGVRLLAGRPLAQETCEEVLRDGYQRQRRAVAYELAFMIPGRSLHNWRARSDRQTSFA